MKTEPIWIVNDNSELGVMVNGVCYFLYKAGSIVYEDAAHDNGDPMYIRPLYKREFGECCLPLDMAHLEKTGVAKYKEVKLSDSEDWVKMPKAPDCLQLTHLRGSECMGLLKQAAK